ncbi:MBL fold metallo-hydrolase [Bacillus dakarensis]|uniref:MBL fold metallo-hydrolase n=1 Tax=Robertmurraya dakarensis TaxID=1926278 RepID=UPI0009811678|nr:MBL fold metallo-hydrolase [Bacillus dakarensis]
MKLTIIGFWGGYPKKDGASSGYLLEHNGFHIMIDFGSAVLSKLQNFLKPEKIDAVLLSHYHPDHIADIGVLQHARYIQGFLGKKPERLPVYGHRLDEQEFLKLTYKEVTKGVEYDPSLPLQVGPFKVTFLRTNHPAACFAMRFEADGKSIVYTADTSFKDELVDFSADCDLLICECNFYSGQDGKNAGHMNSIDAGTLAENAKSRQLLLTHLPHHGDIENLVNEAGQKYKGPITLAEYGKVINI